MGNAKAYADELVLASGFATEVGARRRIRRADTKFYAGQTLEVRVRPSAEWARIGIDKDEFVVVSATIQED